MLFNSYTFILVFLPITLGLFFFLSRYAGRRVAISWLVVASLLFYGWWNPAYLGLIIISILFNYTVGTVLGDERRRLVTRQRIFALAVSVNLAVLGYYKYANFFLENLNALLGTGYAHAEIILPLGISFFTFTQIAFLVDAYRGEVREYNFLHYALFVTYFPHLIAGPVLHHREMMPQFGQRSIFRFDSLNFAAGLSYFVLGLFKKVVIADTLAGLGAPVFAAVAKGQDLLALDAWGGALSYTFQLYFDFSGYSDMAIGLALMMGVRLPLNFNSPYKAVNIIDFWRRWHITLSRFLRDYLYISLGGNKKGPIRRYANLLITMLLGGLWHGAGWTFIIWGALHGGYLIVNHGWHAFRRSLGHDLQSSSWLGRISGTLLTFLAVVVGWIYFRSSDVDTAHRILHSMLSLPEYRLSPFYSDVVLQSAMGAWLAITGIPVNAETILLAVLSTAGTIAFLAPNTQEIMGRFYFAPRGSEDSGVASVAGIWTPNLRWACLISLASVWSLLGLTQVSEFLYFQF